MSYDIWKVPRNEPQGQVRNAVTRSGTFPSKFIASCTTDAPKQCQ